MKIRVELGGGRRYIRHLQILRVAQLRDMHSKRVA